MLPCALVLLSAPLAALAADILGVALHPSFSHQVVFRPLWRELSLRGHRVTVLTTDPIDDPTLTNLTEIDLGFAYDIWRSSGIMEVSKKEGFLRFFVESLEVGGEIMRAELRREEVRRLMEEGRFDLAIVEPVYTLGMGFAGRFGCPMVLVFSIEAVGGIHRLMGNPAHPVQYPSFVFPFDHPMSFVERAVVFSSFFIERYLGSILNRHNNGLMKEVFGEDAPTLERLYRRASLVFTYHNPGFGVVRPTVPTVVTFGGGFHLEPPKELPEDIGTFLDRAREGAVYFSLGTNVLGVAMDRDKLNTFVETFRELPFQVLWKFEGEDLQGKPENVKLIKWAPQQDILRHPNVKAFVTQGGLQSIEEAIYANVPIVGTPQVADQHFNVKRAVNRGIGVKVDLRSEGKEQLRAAILEVVRNEKYRERMRRMVDFADDQPIKGLERAVWWVEYVLRHNDTRHLMPSYVGKPFLEYYDVDVALVLTGVACLMVVITVKICSLGFRCVLRKSGKTKQVK